MTIPNTVRIVEVGPRDGLQNIQDQIPTETKLELIRRLQATGLRSIELTSAVSPRAIPQLADCRTILDDPHIRQMQHDAGLRLPVLVPNLKGLETALAHGATEVAVVVSATEGFSQANIKCSVAEGLERARNVAEKARDAGLAVRGYVSCIFADPVDGRTDRAAVRRCTRELLAMGCYEVSLGDTLGVGEAEQVRGLIADLCAGGIPVERLAGHFHDTYGQAVGNVWAAYGCGVRVFDSSVGGLGGCPYAPGAKGNAATEDLVDLFESAGVYTGVDLGKVVETGVWISRRLARGMASRVGAALAVQHGLLARGQPGGDGGLWTSADAQAVEIQRWFDGMGVEVEESHGVSAF
ncbi:hydroxymethylglutaryl-CoA lyase [Aspergillus clavatus NRRL 1]|uniref:hydroxymethylglutaryl-CoA lyase n=1 Tax=Aspergillus clavatus (strain ATCC 1007 / CBS 513.65 / DSM 816 / NCTC 3887 / NRRL 1 / QM 1276 / 107) TaxID=344612 RepID=A1CG68_ASPCL|nr:3-hydroxymethyl-3-methylglutaryl-Coenzyme A lyase [Aspergillus clavatus NRRL 1]EAW10948.1 3-hydroxymethyl-3-methylglutaryl-Coenzyme A lyase [Aspergillus clavatus NRRL 1]